MQHCLSYLSMDVNANPSGFGLPFLSFSETLGRSIRECLERVGLVSVESLLTRPIIRLSWRQIPRQQKGNTTWITSSVLHHRLRGQGRTKIDCGAFSKRNAQKSCRKLVVSKVIGKVINLIFRACSALCLSLCVCVSSLTPRNVFKNSWTPVLFWMIFFESSTTQRDNSARPRTSS